MSAPVHLKPDLTVPLTADNKAAKIAVVLLAVYLLFINNGKPLTVWPWSDVSEKHDLDRNGW
jgi:hypothetical protein